MGIKSKVTGELEHYRFIHFATHGFFYRDLIAASNARFATTPPATFGDSRSYGHGTLSRLYPGLMSGLALSGANAPTADVFDNGILTAYEVSSLDLRRAELVVLSACETALGDFVRGEGQMSLQWAFHLAGAKSCVASLWSVPDSATQRLMVRFYKNLWNRKMPKLEALREAQIWMIRDRSNRGLQLDDGAELQQALPPRYWAAFTLSGDWR
jgi:CHAT domain-containing protein